MPEGFARWHFSLLEIGASRKQVEVGRTEGAGKNVLECKFVVFLKEAACLKLNCAKTVLINKNKQPLSRDTEFHDAFFPAPSVLPTSTCFRLAPVHNGKKAVDESASYAL